MQEINTVTTEERSALFTGNKRLLDIEAVAKQKNFFETAIGNKKKQNEEAIDEKKEERKSLSSWNKMIRMLKTKGALITTNF